MTLLLMMACIGNSPKNHDDTGFVDTADSGVPADWDALDALSFENTDSMDFGGTSTLAWAADLDGDGASELLLLSENSLTRVSVDRRGRLSDPEELGVDPEQLARAVIAELGGTLTSWNITLTDLGNLDGVRGDELLMQVWISREVQGEAAYGCGTLRVDDALDDAKLTLLSVMDSGSCSPAQVLADADGDGLGEIILHEPDAWRVVFSDGGAQDIVLSGEIMGWVYEAHSHLIHLDDDEWPELVSFPNGGYGFAGGGVAWGSAEGFGTMEALTDQFIHGYVTASDRDKERPEELLVLDSAGQIWWMGLGQSEPSQATSVDDSAQGYYAMAGNFDGIEGLDSIVPIREEGGIAAVGDGLGGFRELPVVTDTAFGQMTVADVDGDGLDDLTGIVWTEGSARLEVLRNTSRD